MSLIIQDPATIEITMPELHKHVKAWLIRHPHVSDMEAALQEATRERFPYCPPDEVLHQAAVNWLNQDKLNNARDASRNLEQWVDTSVQGDMFNDLPMRVPAFIIKNGQPVEYWKCSIAELLEVVESKVAALQMQEQQLREAADAKLFQLNAERANARNIRTAIERARAAGIDPATLTYAKAG